MSRKKQLTHVRQNTLSVDSTNLPVPVLAESWISRIPCDEARGEHIVNCPVSPDTTRGWQNLLSASVRDRTARLASALDAEDFLEKEADVSTDGPRGQNYRHTFSTTPEGA